MFAIEPIHPSATPDMAGLIPAWLANSPADMPFQEVVNAHYCDVWHSWKHGSINPVEETYSYPGDPVQKAILRITRPAADEVILMFASEFFAVLKPDGSWDMARLD